MRELHSKTCTACDQSLMENVEKILLKNNFPPIYHKLYFMLSPLPPFFPLLAQKQDLCFDRANLLVLSYGPSGSPPVERSMGAEKLLSEFHMLTSKERNQWPYRGMDCKHCGSQGPLENTNTNTISWTICTISSSSFSFFIAFWDFSLHLSAGLLQETCWMSCFAAVLLPPFSQSLKGTLGADNFHPQTLLVRKDIVAFCHCQVWQQAS